MKFIELKDYVFAIKNIVYVHNYGNSTLGIKVEGEDFLIHIDYKSKAEASEAYEEIKKILKEFEKNY